MIVNTPDMVLFWKPDSVLSNFYTKAPLVLPQYPDIVFENSEAAFMYIKAITFGDHVMARLMLNDQYPPTVKHLGKRVNSFDEYKWAEVREDVMFAVCYAKFSQNADLKEYLMSTGNKLLVEASPVDKIWGIGLAPNDPKARHVDQWQGLNLLGTVLMEVRTVLVNELVDDIVATEYNQLVLQ